MGIREASLADAAEISALTTSLSDRFIAHEFSAEGRRNLLAALSAEHVRAEMQGDCRYHVYEAAGEILGVVAMRANRHLLKLFVAEAAQGKGIGRALWETAKRTCAAAGYQGPFTVSASRGAVGVYERFGFVREGDETVEDGIIRIPMRTPWPQAVT